MGLKVKSLGYFWFGIITLCLNTIVRPKFSPYAFSLTELKTLIERSFSNFHFFSTASIKCFTFMPRTVPIL